MLMAGLLIGEFGKTSLLQQVTNWQQSEDSKSAAIVDLQTQVEMLKAELQMQEATNAVMQKELMDQIDEMYEQRRELAFYRRIMAPEKEASGVVIEDFVITATASEGFYRFRLVLMQLKRTKLFAKGRITLSLEGSQNGEPTVLDLAKLAELSDQQIKFSFRYFQEIEGAFTLPEGFVPERVEVGASVPARGSRKATATARMFSWQQLLNNT
jgi:hypothetical protein